MKNLFRLLPVAVLVATAADAKPVLPNFDPANFVQGQPIDNPYFPLAKGFVREYSGEVQDANGETVIERVVMQFVGPGPVLAGVATWEMTDLAYVGDLNVEQTRDYYAQDKDGNVWYMGEDVKNIQYDADGKVASTDSHGTWRAGVNDALPGYQMLAHPKPDFAYEQEHSPKDEAMDTGEIMDVNLTMLGKLGPYSNVVAIFETSSIETTLREIKYYAPGIGLIGEDESVDENRQNPEAHFDLVRMAN